MRLESPCEEYGVTQKHGKYDKSFAETNYSFCVMVWETLGDLNSEGEEVLRQIFRFAAKQLGCEFSSYTKQNTQHAVILTHTLISTTHTREHVLL